MLLSLIFPLALWLRTFYGKAEANLCTYLQDITTILVDQRRTLIK